MAKAYQPGEPDTSQLQDMTFDPSEVVLYPMALRTYKALQDAALRKGQPFVEFLQEMFERAVRES